MKSLCYFSFSLFLLSHIHLVQSRPADSSAKKLQYGKLTTEDNEELQKMCGFYPDTQKKSIGSIAALRKEAPWAVSLADLNGTTTYQGCSGTLISNRHVLTAYHCLAQIGQVDILRNVTNPYRPSHGVPGRYVEERIWEETDTLDTIQFVFDDDCAASDTPSRCSVENATIRKAVKAISPKIFERNFNPGHLDVAIFELDQPIEFRSDLYPACLSETKPALLDKLDLYAFGQDNRTTNTLYGALQHIQLTTGSCYPEDPIDSICVQKGYYSAHYGDSGGGFVYKKNKRTFVTGVISGFSPDERDRDVAVAYHLRWICKHTGICVDDTKTEQIATLIDTTTLE